MKKRKIKKSTGITVALLLYVTASAIYLLPRNTGVSDTEKYLTVGGTYFIILLLWLVLRKKEKIQQKNNDHSNKL